MTPTQRLARMQRMFDKKRAILREDYEFFATPRGSIPRVKLGVGWRHGPSGEPQHRVESGHRVEAAVEAERVLVEVSLQMLRRNPVMRAQNPRLQVAEDDVDHGQMGLALVRVAVDGQRFVGVAEVGQVFVADPTVSADSGARSHVALHEAAKLLGAASGGERVGQHLQLGGNARDNLQAQPARITSFLVGIPSLCESFHLAERSSASFRVRTSTAPTIVIW